MPESDGNDDTSAPATAEDRAADAKTGDSSPGRTLEPPPPLADALSAVFRRLVYRGRQEIERAATTGRQRLELRQLQRDRDQFWIRLGKTAYRLVEAGEVAEHPALRKAMARIDELEARIRDMEARRPPDGEPR